MGNIQVDLSHFQSQSLFVDGFINQQLSSSSSYKMTDTRKYSNIDEDLYCNRITRPMGVIRLATLL